MLGPGLDVPVLPPDTESESSAGSGAEAEVEAEAEAGVGAGVGTEKEKKEEPQERIVEVPAAPESVARRRRKKPAEGDLSNSIMGGVHNRDADADDDDRTWYLYIPGLVGAGTALLVVGLLSLSSWRKSQGS